MDRRTFLKSTVAAAVAVTIPTARPEFEIERWAGDHFTEWLNNPGAWSMELRHGELGALQGMTFRTSMIAPGLQLLDKVRFSKPLPGCQVRIAPDLDFMVTQIDERLGRAEKDVVIVSMPPDPYRELYDALRIEDAHG
jgi:hypothetical protein